MDSDRASSLFAQAVRESGLTVVDEGFYKFSPHGFTCFLLLAESYASLYSWPELTYFAIDLFFCALGKDLMPLLLQLKNVCGPDGFSIIKADRASSLESKIAS